MAWLACDLICDSTRTNLKADRIQVDTNTLIIPETRHTGIKLHAVCVTFPEELKFCWSYLQGSYDLCLHLQIQRYNISNRHLQRVGSGSIKADKNLIMDRHLFVDQRRSL